MTSNNLYGEKVAFRMANPPFITLVKKAAIASYFKLRLIDVASGATGCHYHLPPPRAHDPSGIASPTIRQAHPSTNVGEPGRNGLAATNFGQFA